MLIKVGNINKNEVLKYLSYRGSDIPADIDSLIDSCMSEIIEKANSKFTYKKFKLENYALENISFDLEGKDVKDLLQSSEFCSLYAVTLGVEIDILIKRYQYKDLTRGIVLDSCASSAIESLANQVEVIIKSENEGMYLTDRFSPGYGDMPIDCQKQLLNVLNAEKLLGVKVTDSGIMIPRKSSTGIVGISTIEQNHRHRGCENCAIFIKCTLRKEGDDCGYK